VEFNLYRVTQPGGNILERDLIQAIGFAHVRDNVDAINISAGNDHSDDGNGGCARRSQPCKVQEAAGKAVKDGIPVIAAAGNSDQYSSVCCPSLNSHTISVGGFVPKCGFKPDFVSSAQDSQVRPPHAIWDLEDGDCPPICSGKDCYPGVDASCKNNREIVNWSGNVDPVWNKPDILAPCAYPNGGSVLWGTSWSAPFITAWVVETMIGVRDRGKEPPAYVFRQALENTAKKLDSGEELLLDEWDALRYVHSELDLPRPNKGSKERFDAGSGVQF